MAGLFTRKEPPDVCWALDGKPGRGKAGRTVGEASALQTRGASLLLSWRPLPLFQTSYGSGVPGLGLSFPFPLLSLLSVLGSDSSLDSGNWRHHTQGTRGSLGLGCPTSPVCWSQESTCKVSGPHGQTLPPMQDSILLFFQVVLTF